MLPECDMMMQHRAPRKRQRVQRKRKPGTTKYKYIKKGVKSQLLTEYSNSVVQLFEEAARRKKKVQGSEKDERDREKVKSVIADVVDLNEIVVEYLQQLCLMVLGIRLQSKSFKRNHFMNQNSLLFCILFAMQRFDVVDVLVDLKFKHGTDAGVKKKYEVLREQLSVASLKPKKFKTTNKLLFACATQSLAASF